MTADPTLSTRVDQLAALAHPQRLAVFRLLMRRVPQEIAAGELAEVLALKQNTLSNHLTALRHAGLIAQRREGRSILYRAEVSAADALLNYLHADCCRSRVLTCPPLLPSATGETAMTQDRKLNVLFICSGNSARSIIAEALLRHYRDDKFNVYSAGTQPYSEINPRVLQLLNDKEISTEGLYAKNVSVFQGEGAPVMDFVFTVCDQAANEECPAWEGQPISAHWGLPDPVKATGTEAEKQLAFQRTYGALYNRLKAFSALPFETLSRKSLQAEVDALAEMAEDTVSPETA